MPVVKKSLFAVVGCVVIRGACVRHIIDSAAARILRLEFRIDERFAFLLALTTAHHLVNKALPLIAEIAATLTDQHRIKDRSSSCANRSGVPCMRSFAPLSQRLP
jgi:hypothetical protein